MFEAIRRIVPYVLTALVSILILFLVLQLWKADLGVPLSYFGDALYYSMLVKTLVETGWVLHNDRLGMPLGLDLHDFPSADPFHLLVIKAFSFLIHDPVKLFNLFYLATYPLVALSSFYVLRRFSICNPLAICFAILYAFIPFHLYSGCGHMFLSSYYMVPLAIMVALWIAQKRFLLPNDITTTRSVFAIIFCIVLGVSGIFYYPFFACIFFITAGISAAMSMKSWRPLFTSLVLVSVVSASLLISLTPQILFLIRNGDVKAARRTPVEAEIYGLKITQMVLPAANHRIAALAELKRTYNAAPLSQENEYATIGLISSVGFLLLLWWTVFKPASTQKMNEMHDLLRDLGLFNLVAVLIATVGGFGSLFALLVSPQIRVYHRMCVFISFFSLLALALLLQRALAKFGKLEGPYVYALAIALLAVGILDQTNHSFIPPYERDQKEARVNKEFIEKLERNLPPGSMVFQLPYMLFPGSPPVNNMQDSDHFKAYLLSRTLRWSYGAIKDRPADVWQRRVVTLPVPSMVEELSVAGFRGIYLNRDGFADRGQGLETGLSSLLGPPKFESEDGRLAFYDLLEYSARLKGSVPPETWEAKRRAILDPVKVLWKGGFSNWEGTPEKNWRWCSSEGILELRNPRDETVPLTLEMTLRTGHATQSSIQIKGLSIDDRLSVSNEGIKYTKQIPVPHGTHQIKFFCDAPRIDEPKDARVLVFKVEDFKLNEIIR